MVLAHGSSFLAAWLFIRVWQSVAGGRSLDTLAHCANLVANRTLSHRVFQIHLPEFSWQKRRSKVGTKWHDSRGVPTQLRTRGAWPTRLSEVVLRSQVRRIRSTLSLVRLIAASRRADCNGRILSDSRAVGHTGFGNFCGIAVTRNRGRMPRFDRPWRVRYVGLASDGTSRDSSSLVGCRTRMPRESGAGERRTVSG